MLERAAMLRRPGRWQLHAAIAACHADARDGDDHRLAAGAHALRHAARVRPVAHRAAQPGGGARRDRRTAGGPGRSRRAAGRLCRATTSGTRCVRACSADSGATTRRWPKTCCALELTANEAERRLLGAASALSRASLVDPDPASRVAAQASTGESAAETRRSSVVIPSRDRIDSRCPCTEANPGPRSA